MQRNSLLIPTWKTVKFKSVENRQLVISDQDRTIASLKLLISDLNHQVEILSVKISEATTRAREAASGKNRTIALAALRSRKITEATLTQRVQTLSQLEEVYHQIEQAADQVDIIKVMQGSTSVLRGLRAETGGIEKVEDVLEDLRDEMSKVNEVNEAIEASTHADSVVDEGEIDDELEQMMLHAKKEDEKREAQLVAEKLAALPVVGNVKEEKPAEGSEHQAQPSENSKQRAEGSLDVSIQAIGELSLESEGRELETS